MSYLENAWYAAAWAEELADKPLGRIFLEQPVVLFRDGAGRPAALADRCAHRFAPLSMGTVVDGDVRCPYHGLRFAPDGRCVHSPHGDGAVPKAQVRTYPLFEKYQLIWIWMGAAERADPSDIPDFSLVDRTDLATVRGYLSVSANYQLVTDNLLDLSHGEFLHPMLGTPGSSKRVHYRADQAGDEVWSYYDYPNEPLTPMTRMIWNADVERGDRWVYMRWTPASNLLLDIGHTTTGGAREDGMRTPSAHFLTPVSEFMTHYFWVSTRNRQLDDAALSKRVQEGIDRAFRMEDEPMVAACQQRMGSTDLMQLRPTILPTDVAAVRARMHLRKRISEDQADQTVNTAARLGTA